jgi:Protein of unknown function (DUF3128)
VIVNSHELCDLLIAAPFHQMQQYYRCGEFDNCFAKWNDLIDCLTLKTKKSSEVEVVQLLISEASHSFVYITLVRN